MKIKLLPSMLLGLYIQSTTATIPIVFHPDYDISFFGIEKLHPFDSKKYGKIAQYLQQTCNIFSTDFQKPEKITDAQLTLVHTTEYLKSLHNSYTVAKITEIAPLCFLPNFLVQRNVLNSMRYATTGTVLGAQLALAHGWAINLSGGYHHAKAHKGEGFCVYADIPLAIKTLRKSNPTLKVLIVDLDAHQGNGLETIMGPDPLTYIFDMYSNFNYPQDFAARAYIDFNYPLFDYINDQKYLTILEKELPQAIKTVNPDLIIYNAGSDVFEEDPLGKMRVTQNGIIKRDFFVFSTAMENKIPILMVLSGGYSTQSANIVSKSIENIIKTLKLVDQSPRIAPHKKWFK